MDLFSLIAGFVGGFVGGAFYQHLEDEKEAKIEQERAWKASADLEAKRREQVDGYRKLFAESQKKDGADHWLDWRDTLTVAQTTLAKRRNTTDWAAEGGDTTGLRHSHDPQMYLFPTVLHKESFFKAVGDWTFEAHWDYTEAKHKKPPVVRVAVCSLDCKGCMEAVAETPNGVPFIVGSQNSPHDDEGAG